MRERLSNHELFGGMEHRGSGEVLCYSVASVSPASTRRRAKAAVAFRRKQVVNDEYTRFFPFDTTTISVTGSDAKLTSTFTVKKDAAD